MFEFDISNKAQGTENEVQTQEIANQQTKTLDNDLPMILNSVEVLKNLEVEEQALLEEKANLTNIHEKLTQKVKDEICTKGDRISELKQKIPELKQNCEKMANVLGIQIQTQTSINSPHLSHAPSTHPQQRQRRQQRHDTTHDTTTQ